MKRIGIVSVLALILGGFASVAFSDDKPQAPDLTAEQKAEMAEWMKLSAPSEHHKFLDAFVGTWKTTSKMWMGGPGSQTVESTGTSEFKWTLGNRFLMEEHHGAMMGVPYDGIGMTGYDNFRNVYTTTWCSNQQTNMLTMTGTRNPETGVFTYFGQMDEPSLKLVGRTVKYANRPINPDKFLFEIIDLPRGDDFKVIEITYERQK